MLATVKAQAEKFLKEVSSSPTRGLVGVFGDVALDRFVFGDVERISPEAPVPVLNYQRTDERLGCAANVVANVSGLCESWNLGLRFCSLLGTDPTAERIESMLAQLPAPPENFFLRDAGRRTSLKTRFLAGSQHQLLRVDEESSRALASAQEKEILSFLRPLLSGLKTFVVQDYAKGLLTPEVSREIFKVCRDQGVFCIVDPCKRTKPECYTGAHMMTPNVSEAEILLGNDVSLDKGRDDGVIEQAMKQLSAKLKLDHVMITRSQYGLSVYTAKSGESIHLPAIAREVYDVTGAGDTVVAVLAGAMASGASLPVASLLAAVAASVVVAKVGTSTVQISEIQRHLARV